MLAVAKHRPMTSPTSSPNLFWRLSLLGHQVMDVVRGTRRGALTAQPLLHYAVLGFFAIAALQVAGSGTSTTAPSPQTQFATAGLFGAGATETSPAADDLAALDRYRTPVARHANRMGLDRTALEVAVLLAARDGAEVDVRAFAKTLQSAAADAATHDAWVRAAATLFPAPDAAEAQLRYLIRRYGL